MQYLQMVSSSASRPHLGTFSTEYHTKVRRTLDEPSKKMLIIVWRRFLQYGTLDLALGSSVELLTDIQFF